MYEITQELTASAGLPAYEISNHARPGAESRHNLIYWRYGDYAGIGPGAHGRLTLEDGRRVATETVRDPAGWTAAVEETGEAVSACEAIGAAEQAEEYALLSLRLAEGMDLDRYARLAGAPPAEARIDALCQSGHLMRHGARLRATAEGRIVLNTVLADLLA